MGENTIPGFKTKMKTLTLSKNSAPQLIKYLKDQGYNIELFGPIAQVAEPINCHPDLVFTWLKPGCIFKGNPETLTSLYPGDIRYNAASTGKYFLHNLKYTDSQLLERTKSLGLKLIDVPQGYSKCSICIVDEDSIITYDRGIVIKARQAGLDVLEVSPGHIELPGFDTGFIGGCSGLVDGKLIFNGDLSAHPAYGAICDFLRKKKVGLKYFAQYPLTDIGSIIENE